MTICIELCSTFIVLAIVNARSLNSIDDKYDGTRAAYFDENNASHWMLEAQGTLRGKLERPLDTRRARNLILFVGDGMSMPTLAATRQYVGHVEEYKLSFEDFPYTGLARTYCVDRQVPDSACSATAYMCGVKGNFGTIGLSGGVQRGACAAQSDPAHQLRSIAAWAQDAGKRTGVVTTTRVTHGTPASVYAHAAERRWESDTDMQAHHDANCSDIAEQLVRGPVGDKLNVIFGGGRRNFLPKTVKDEEGFPGVRSDGVNLIDEWTTTKKRQGAAPAYILNRSALMDLDVASYDHVMGLFESDHMRYHLEADPEADPSLAEMTAKAIEILEQNNPNGYFLFVEGGRIDQAHHITKAKKALDETAEFSKAVAAATRMVAQDTLVVVTSDHSHTMSYNGYNPRGTDVLGPSQTKAADGLPYMVLTYANGPGYRHNDEDNRRYNILNDKNIGDANFTYPALFPMDSETHGGEDVAVFAQGPWSHLFTGCWEQTYIAHAMAFAACIGPGATACD